MATVGRNKRAQLWEITRGQEFKRLQGPKLGHVIFSPDGKTMAGISDGTLRDRIYMWKLGNDQQILRLEGLSYNISNVAFSPNGKLLAGGSTRVKLWDTASGDVTHHLDGHRDQIECVAFSPDGRLLATGSRDNTIGLWDTAEGVLVKRLVGHAGEIHSVAFSPDGHTLASGSWDTSIGLWNVESGQEMGRLRAHRGYVNSVAFNVDGRLLVSGSWDRTVRLWGLDIPPAEWRKLESTWQKEFSHQWQQSKRCVICGDAIRFWHRWRGIKHCRRHRPSTSVRQKSQTDTAE